MTSPEARLSAERIQRAVAAAGLGPLPAGTAEKFSRYYRLLEQWNSRLNLTAIRDPEEALRRHFVECIFCAQNLPENIETLLDYGSGAGFPGIPIALCRPEIRVTLAESQGKKASFLRETVRSLELTVEVYGGRVEAMPSSHRFGAVALRAVDNMAGAVEDAANRVNKEGWLIVMATAGTASLPKGFSSSERSIPGSRNGMLIVGRK